MPCQCLDRTIFLWCLAPVVVTPALFLLDSIVPWGLSLPLKHQGSLLQLNIHMHNFFNLNLNWCTCNSLKTTVLSTLASSTLWSNKLIIIHNADTVEIPRMAQVIEGWVSCIAKTPNTHTLLHVCTYAWSTYCRNMYMLRMISVFPVTIYHINIPLFPAKPPVPSILRMVVKGWSRGRWPYWAPCVRVSMYHWYSKPVQGWVRG